LTPDQYMEQLQKDIKTKSDVKNQFIQNVVGEKLDYNRTNTPRKKVNLFWKGCSKSEFSLSKRINPVKLFIQECDDCIFYVNSILTTRVIELWRCKNVVVHIDVEIGTFQVDISSNITISYQHKKQLGSVVQAGVENLIIQFKDAEESNFVTGVSLLKEQYQDYDENDQFITRWINKDILTERIVRIQGGYPSTERELKESEEGIYDEKKTKESLNQFLEQTGQSIGIDEKSLIEKSVEGKKEQEEKIKKESKSNLKKHAGNKFFVKGKIQQAIQLFTEAIDLTPNNHLLYSNRAACYLKIGDWEKALEDSQRCIELDEEFAKGHYRKALSLIELGRLDEALISIKEAYDIEPEDEDIKEKLEFVKEKLK